MAKISKAVIIAAGRGTRFLPVSKAYQKEFVPIMAKPQIQYVIEEAIDSGIHEIAIVVREGIDTLERYLEDDAKLGRYLKETGKEELMDSWLNLKKNSEIIVLEQKETDPYGNGTPFVLAKDFIGSELFVGMFGDDIMVHVDESKPLAIKQLIEYCEDYSPSVVMSACEVPKEKVNLYGICEYLTDSESAILHQIKTLVEKPEIEKAPSRMAITCRFILGPELIEELEKNVTGKGGEVWLTDAVSRLIQKGRVVIAPPIEGSIWIPVGDPINWLKANLIVALNNPNTEDEVREILSWASNAIPQR